MKVGKLYEIVEITDEVPVGELRFIDSLRNLFKKIFHSDADELDSEMAVSSEENELKANLLKIVEIGLEPIRAGEEEVVYLKIASEFTPVLKEVFTSREIKNFYTVLITKPDLGMNIKFFYRVKLRVKKKKNGGGVAR